MLYNLPCWTSSSVIAAEWRLWYKQLKTHSQELNRFWLNYSVSGEQFQLTTTWILQTRYIFNDQSYINSRYLHFLLENMNIIFKAKQKRAPTALTVDCSVCGAPAPDHIHFGGWFSITSYQRIKEQRGFSWSIVIMSDKQFQEHVVTRVEHSSGELWREWRSSPSSAGLAPKTVRSRSSAKTVQLADFKSVCKLGWK